MTTGFRRPGISIVVLVLTAEAVGLVLLARRWFVVVEVNGGSMFPTYRQGDRVLLRRIRPAAIRPGQVVVFQSPLGRQWCTGRLGGPHGSRWLVKRVAAIPGDPVPPDVAEAVLAAPGARVPVGQLVAIGDGLFSVDSRTFGYVPADRVLGVVVHAMSRRDSSEIISEQHQRSAGARRLPGIPGNAPPTARIQRRRPASHAGPPGRRPGIGFGPRAVP